MSEQRDLQYQKHMAWFWRLLRWATAAFFLFIAYLWFFELPSFSELENPKSVTASEVLAGDGTSLGRYYLENRVPVTYNDLPKALIDAVVATEDERYYNHSGIDARALGRVVKGVVTGDKAGGGSTIPQQLAKLLFERPDRKAYNAISWKFVMVKTKIKEWLIAVQLERRYTKEEILAMYFNKFNFNYGAYGIKTAAEIYFGKLPKELNMEECALLVGMLQNPTLHNPRRFPDRAIKRREVVLYQMQRKGIINKAKYDELRVKPIDLSNFKTRDHQDGLAPYFREELRRETAKLLKDIKKPDGTPYDLYADGLKIHTTINPKIQQYAEDAVYEHFKMLQNQMYRHWAKLDPWSYKQTGVDDSEIAIRKKALELQIKMSDRYQAIRDRKCPTIRALELREADIDRILELDTKGSRLMEDWVKTKFITPALAEKYTEALKTDNLRKIKSEVTLAQLEASRQFTTPVKMKVFAFKRPTMNKDTTMSPTDSVRYHRMTLQTGLMAVDPKSGYVLAWVGGSGFNTFKYDHVNQTAARQVGSTFKPYLYALSIQQRAYSPCFTVVDRAVTFPRGTFGLSAPWQPDNADGGYSGASFSLYDALLYSKNTVSAYLMKDLGDTKPLREFIARMGIDTTFRRVPAKPSICLGACEISVFEMTGAYTTFANDGIYSKPIFITKIEDKNGNPIYEAVQEQTRVLSKGANYVMTKMLQHVAKGTPEFGGMKSAIGGKTGTTNYAADCWFMGITPSLVVGTWTGCDDRWVRFRDFTWGQGGKQARPIFAKLMKKLEADPLSGYVVVDSGFVRPSGQLEIEVDCRKYSGGSGLPSVIFKDEEIKPQAPQGADPTHGDEFE
jgi:penicillin-binding protein 1A